MLWGLAAKFSELLTSWQCCYVHTEGFYLGFSYSLWVQGTVMSFFVSEVTADVWLFFCHLGLLCSYNDIVSCARVFCNSFQTFVLIYAIPLIFSGR